MSALPKEVRKKIEAAEKAHKELYGPKDPAAPAPDPAPADPQAIVNDINATPTPDPKDLGVADPAPADPPPADPAPTPDPAEEETFKAKYHTLQGKYDAEVPRLHNEVKALHEQISSLQQLLASMKQPEAAPEPVAPNPSTLLKPEEIEEFGPELIDVINRVAKGVVSPEVQKLREENAQLTSQLGEVQTHTAENARSRMYSTLTTTVPTWEQINTSPEFLTWLEKLDVFAGVRRGDLLKQAFEANDTARVVAFFEGYQNEHAALSPNTPPTAAPEGKKPAVDMATLAAPGRPKGGGAERTQDGKRKWRQAEITAFYADVRRGVYKKDAKTKDTIEKDIIAAGREGRITA